jgi:protein subunit release factor A
VRLLHVPTGLVAIATERRSQYINKLVALERLAARLAARNRKRKPRVPTAPPESAREHRLGEKARRARTKSLRGKVPVPVEE